jgi:hypothetical protein
MNRRLFSSPPQPLRMRGHQLPVTLPDRSAPALHDAGQYIRKLPKAQHDLPHWQHAAEHLLRASLVGADRITAAPGSIWTGSDWGKYPVRAYARSIGTFPTKEAALAWALAQPD